MQRLYVGLAVVLLGCAVVFLSLFTPADLHGQNAQGLVARGNASFDKGDFDQAIADYNQALRLNPKNAVACYGRGLAWYNKDQYDKALADYDQAIAIDPKNATFCNGRGIAWYKKGEYDKAIADFDKAIAIDPKDKYAYNNRGNAWREKGEYDKAIADFNQALEVNPGDKFANYNRGLAWNKKDEYDKAIADYAQALVVNPNHAEAYNQLGWLAATCPDAKYRDKKRAFDFANKAYELEAGKRAISIDTLAAAYAENSDFANAKHWEEKAIGVATAEKEKEEYRGRLELYKQGKPYRQERKKK